RWLGPTKKPRHVPGTANRSGRAAGPPARLGRFGSVPPGASRAASSPALRPMREVLGPLLLAAPPPESSDVEAAQRDRFRRTEAAPLVSRTAPRPGHTNRCA